MSVEFWVAAERFYTFTLPVLVLVLGIGFIVACFVFFYAPPGETIKRNTVVIALAVLVLAGGYTWWGHDRYADLLTVNESITPGIRTYRMLFGIENHEDREMVELSQESSRLGQYLAELDYYEAERVTLELEYDYIGNQSDTHYFAINDRNACKFWFYFALTSSAMLH